MNGGDFVNQVLRGALSMPQERSTSTEAAQFHNAVMTLASAYGGHLDRLAAHNAQLQQQVAVLKQRVAVLEAQQVPVPKTEE